MKMRKLRKKILELSNDGGLTLFPVGCGAAFSKQLFQNNWLIVKGNDHVMVDCGTRTPKALSELGRSVSDITTWLITHSHADHIGGLEEVMLFGRYVSKQKPAVIITEEYQQMLWEESLRGGAAHNERIDGRVLAFEDFWKIIRPELQQGYPRETHEIQVGSINLKLFRTNHYPQQADTWEESAYSVGLVIDDRILFTGDTQSDPALVFDFEKRFTFEYIFHDVQFFPGGIHCNLDALEEFSQEITSKMFLMHYPDNYRQFRKRVNKRFAGFVKQGTYYDFG